MIEVSAEFFDGKTSEKRPVRVHFLGTGKVRITGLDRELLYDLSEARFSTRVGNTPRSIYLPGGAKCETRDNDSIDRVLELVGRGWLNSAIFRLESRLGYAAILLLLTIGGIWGLVEYGIPALARRAAFALPRSADESLGREGLRVLDSMLLSPSELDSGRRDELRALFEEMTSRLADARNYRLVFRRSPAIGPNAFALPSGIIILTDELVLLARHDGELKAVLAHEMGHVVYRHTLRTLLQNSTMVLLIASVTGDVTSITALSSTLPAMLMEARYSRALEREADEFALEYLRANHIPARYFADILIRMEEETGREGMGRGYLSSHPSTEERIRQFQGE